MRAPGTWGTFLPTTLGEDLASVWRAGPNSRIRGSPIGIRRPERHPDHMRPRVLVVDDEAAFRAVARDLLEHGGFDVVGEAADATAALRFERELRPDVVLLDVRLPDATGLDVALAMSGHEAPPSVVLVSTADYGYVAPGCGARGFLLKTDLTAEALRDVLSG